MSQLYIISVKEILWIILGGAATNVAALVVVSFLASKWDQWQWKRRNK